MNIDEKIVSFLRSQKSLKNATLGRTRISAQLNKDGEKLLYVRASILEKKLGINYSNKSIYYAFDVNGNYVGCVKISVLNYIPPTQVEMEYWANEEYKNKGNITIIAQEVIKEVFVDNEFDNLRVRDNEPTSNIDTIMVAINQDNYASLAVAKKLGFDENGMLYKEDYLKKTKESTSINI